MASKDQEQFSKLANCYAYAAKQKRPINSGKSASGQAKPGSVGSFSPPNTYYAALKNGVLSDGGTNVKFISDYDISTLTSVNVPTVDSSTYYLIAMIVCENGFHFVRRQRKRAFGTPFWKWKQGNPGLVERNAYSVSANDYVRINDAELPSLVQGKEFLTEPPGYPTDKWKKIYFFQVKTAGFKVTMT